ncbi:hypothetical protein Tco_0873889 [Tanacetum coccineum]|uniref:Uncharacterized protein n=1 Tax=Tanacetum coccineum TaxID=301880 RepID=A0ABQ5BNQ1_9ASTR
MGHFLKTQAYIDLESPINVMSKQHYNMIMSKGLESRQEKTSNLVRKESCEEHHLGEVVFGNHCKANIGLVYDQEEGMVTFEKDCEEITFKMPHKMELSNHIDFKNINTDSIPPFVLGSNDAHGKTYYSDSLTLGFEYKGDESISKEIRHLMILEIEAKRHKGEVTLYLMRRRLEVLRKFHWMILGGRFNQYLAFGRHLEEIHLTWAHLEKKQKILRTNTKTLQDLKSQRLETASPVIHDVVTLHVTWAHLEKKRTRLRDYATSLKIMFSVARDGVTNTM